MDSSAITFADDLPASTLHDRVERGQLVRIGPGSYSAEVDADPADIVRRSWRELVARRFPDAVVTDRSAVWAQPHDGHLFVSAPRGGTLELPGLTVKARTGPGPVDGDLALGAGVHLASRARALLDNTRATRARDGRLRATLTKSELADWIDHLCAVDGIERLRSYRTQAEALARVLEVPAARVGLLNDLVGAALGTRPAARGSAALRARSRGVPFDQSRVIRFELLADHLRDVVATHPALPVDAGRRATLPFWEAYFSNFIEGTEFSPEEAERIVYGGEIPMARPADAHDVLGTFALVSDDVEMRRRDGSADEFIERLREWHQIILGGRAEKRPGELKVVQNQAGSTVFVAPELVEGTLRRGYDILRSLVTPTQRATFAMFLVAEVHPFDDGNGRLARAVMNAELVAGDEVRAVVPTVARNDYLRALRRLSRQDRPELLVAFLDRVRRWTARVDWSDLAVARQALERTHALVDANDAEDRGLQLTDPGTDEPALISGIGV